MRLICSIKDQGAENAYEFSYYLTSQGIENECEPVASSDECRIWVYEEDLVDQAQQFYKEYQSNPQDPRFRAHYEAQMQTQASTMQNDEPDVQPPARVKRKRFLSPAPYGPLSILILFIVAALFIWAQLERGLLIPPKIPGVIQAPILAPIERALIYDYPVYFELRDKLLKLYTPEEIEAKQPPSQAAQKLIQELRKTSTWMGAYDRFVQHFQDPSFPLTYDGPMFGKIRQGQVWRVLTPAFLHFDLLHIFFNVLWFILLGNQIEYRLGWFRYLILIIITAICSNTAQYLMSGPFFMGLSGVVVGMAGFIWARQQKAPWEGYLLHRFTLIFLALFVVGMFFLQLIFFALQLLGKFELTIGIANTAHIIGGIVGYLLGRMRFFALHPKHKN